MALHSHVFYELHITIINTFCCVHTCVLQEVVEEERHHNEQTLITVVSDSISSIVVFSLISQQSRGRQVRGHLRGRSEVTVWGVRGHSAAGDGSLRGGPGVTCGGGQGSLLARVISVRMLRLRPLLRPVAAVCAANPPSALCAQALFSTISRLFDGLSDIAKAVMIILIADTLLGYHSEEGWTGLIELVVGHYG